MMQQCKIPKIVMQTWMTEDVPDGWKLSPESVKGLMPDWEYVLMTDKDNQEFVAKHFPDFLETFNSFKYGIQRADAIRACWLYVNGGVYMDLDLVIKKPLDELFYSDCEAYFVSSANITSSKTNSFMASKPGCPIWLEYIEEMKERYKNPGTFAVGKHFHVMCTTGPVALTRVLDRTKTVYAMLPTTLVMPCTVCDVNKGIINVPDDAFLYPLKGGSWNDWTSHGLNILMCNWRTFAFILIVIIVFLLILLLLFASKRLRKSK